MSGRATGGCKGLRWLVSGCLLLASAAGGREPPPRFEHLSVEHGLSHGAVYSILQDATGFMWFGTEDGLNRYDGLSTSIYRHDPVDATNSLASSNFGEVYEDRSGLLWFGTWGGGLDRYDPATGAYTHYRHDPEDPASLSQDRIEVLLEDSAGKLWVGTEEAGLNRFDPVSGRFERFRHDPADPHSLSHDEVRAIAEDRDGTVWVGTNGGLSRFDRDTKRFSHYVHDPSDAAGLGHDRVRAIVESRSGDLWIGTRGGGLERFDPDSGVFRHYRHEPGNRHSLASDSIACLHEETSGVLWIGTYDAGLSRFDPQTGIFTSYRQDSKDSRALASNRIEKLYEDRAGVLWIATRGAGVDRLDLKPAKFVSYKHETDGSGLPPGSVRALAQEAGDHGALWLGTDGGGLVRLDRATGDVHPVRRQSADGAGLSDDRVWSLLIDRSGDLWVGTYSGGLNRLIRTGGDRFERWMHDPEDPSSLSHDRVQVIYQDRGGDVWVGTAGGLNRVVDRGGRLSFESFLHDPEKPGGLSDDYVVSLLQDSGGALWVGTRRGLHRRLDDGDFQRFESDMPEGRALSTGLIQAIVEDAGLGGVLWIGTEGSGLYRLDPAHGEVRRFLVEDGLPSNVIDGILQDDLGRLWLSSSRGLSRFDPSSESFRNYDGSDGLESHSFVRSACFKARDGEMFFGGVASLTAFFPGQVRDNPHRPPVVLTSLKVFDRELELEQPLSSVSAIELDHSQNFVTLEFAALDYSAPSRNRYAYRLAGADRDWIQAGTRPYASYAHLEPGRYVFTVKAANSDGVWNPKGRSLAIVVEPAYWQSWWFRAAALGLLGLALVAGHRSRIRAERFRHRLLEEQIAERERAAAEQKRLIGELEEKNAEMERFTYTVSHDLKSPLVTIKGFLGFLERDVAGGDRERVKLDIARISSAADRMHRLLEELLDLSRVGRVVNPATRAPFGELVREAVELVAGQINASRVEIDVAPDLPVVVGDRVRLLEVLQNLLDNSIKFMGEQATPRIEIGAAREGGETVFFVRDNGQGIEPRYHAKVFNLFERLDAGIDGTGIGLALVKRIVEVHQGRIWVESEGRGHGATFYFTLPVAPQNLEPSARNSSPAPPY